MLAGARTKLPTEDRIGGLAVDANDNLFVLDNGRRKRILVFERGQAGNTPPSRIIDLPTLQNRILETIALSDSGKTAYIVTDKTAEPTSREGNVAQIHALRLSDRVGVVSRSRSIPLYCNDDSISL
jgi:hypothetical protein